MVLRQAAFVKKGTFLKGNLHCHTTLSDGKGSPASVIRQYENAGYDFLAITDHQRYNFKNYEEGSNLLILPGIEEDRFLDGVGMPVLHIVGIGPEEGNGYTDGQPVHYQRGGTADQCQDIIDNVRAAGNLAILCHPMWSGNTAEEIKALHDFQMIEVWNTGAALDWGTDSNTYHWDVLLHEGRRVYAVASDDGHNLQQNCFGWVRVNAEKNVPSILKALENGEFYASCGPEIYDFYVDEENEKVVIECSPAAKIRLHSDGHPTRIQNDAAGNLTRAEFALKHWCGKYRYVRMTVIDKDGKYAWTNPIFLG